MSRKPLDLIITCNNIEYAITTKSPLYRLKHALINKCINRPFSKSTTFMSDEWRTDPESFYKWCLDNGWKRGLILSRININDGYHPGNCHFVTIKNKYNSHKKLTWQKVKEIRDKLNQGIKLLVLSDQYKVSPGHISSIKNNRQWKDMHGNYD